jgi:acyl dehydratase
MIWFEDLPAGRLDRYAVTREEVLAFARAYDPQPFHVDDAAAAANPLFGRLAASGWHTAAMGMRMTADHWAALGGRSILGGAGIEDLRWIVPVHPGDTLRCESTVLEARPSRSNPDRGLVRTETALFNQHDACVMRHTSTVVVQRRPAEDRPA